MLSAGEGPKEKADGSLFRRSHVISWCIFCSWIHWNSSPGGQFFLGEGIGLGGKEKVVRRQKTSQKVGSWVAASGCLLFPQPGTFWISAQSHQHHLCQSTTLHVISFKFPKGFVQLTFLSEVTHVRGQWPDYWWMTSQVNTWSFRTKRTVHG